MRNEKKLTTLGEVYVFTLATSAKFSAMAIDESDNWIEIETQGGRRSKINKSYIMQLGMIRGD